VSNRSSGTSSHDTNSRVSSHGMNSRARSAGTHLATVSSLSGQRLGQTCAVNPRSSRGHSRFLNENTGLISRPVRVTTQVSG